jgi:hypothetical protein
MTKQLMFVILLCGFVTAAFGQEQTEKKRTGRPDIPGIFNLEFGLNGHSDAPGNFSTGVWGSRTFNVYYQYEFRLFHSPFAIVPGLGLSLERFKLKNNYTVGYTTPAHDEIALIPPAEAGVPDISKSMLIANYFEVPIELRFSTKPNDPARSFNISFGARVGVLYDSFTKLKYKEDGETKKLKNKQDYHLTQFRYGLMSRIGFGDFSIVGYYNLTPLFEEGNGLKENGQFKDFNTFTIGISLASF